jgi:trigger factor
MQISHLSSQGLKQEYKVVIPAGDVSQSVDEHLNKLGKTAKLPGFRPGKVPFSILKQRFSQEALSECIEESAKGAVREVVEKNSLRLIGKPTVEYNYDEEKGVEYTVSFELFPELSLGNFSEIQLEKLIATVSDQDVDKHLGELLNSTYFEEAEEGYSVQQGDRVHFDIKTTLDGADHKIFEPRQVVVVQSDKPFLSGELEAMIVGKKNKETFTVTEKIPSDFHISTLAHKDVVVTVGIVRIEKAKKYELNDDFLKRLNLDSPEALNASIRESLTNHAEYLEGIRMKRLLLDALNQRHSFDLPASLVDREFEAIWKQLQSELAQSQKNGTLEEGIPSEEELKAEYKQLAERRVRLGLIIAEVATLNNIELDRSEVTNRIYAEASKYPSQMKEVVNFYSNNSNALNTLLAPLLEDKVISHILTQTSLTEKQVTYQDLLKEIKGIVPGYEEDSEEESEPKKVSE